MFSEKTGNPSGRPAWVAGQPKKQIGDREICLMNPHPGYIYIYVYIYIYIYKIKPNAAETIYRFGIFSETSKRDSFVGVQAYVSWNQYTCVNYIYM